MYIPIMNLMNKQKTTTKDWVPATIPYYLPTINLWYSTVEPLIKDRTSYNNLPTKDTLYTMYIHFTSEERTTVLL